MVDIHAMTYIATTKALKLYAIEPENANSNGAVLDTETGAITEIDNIQKAFKFSAGWTSVITVTKKHLPGEHDQKTHTPKRYGQGKNGGYKPGTGDYKFGETRGKVTNYNLERVDYEQDPKLNALLDNEFPANYTWSTADMLPNPVPGRSLASLVKENIVENLAEKTGLDKATVNLMAHQWAETSNGNDAHSLSLQEAASQEFGLPLSNWQQELVDEKKQLHKEYQEYYAYVDDYAKEHGLEPGEGEAPIGMTPEQWSEMRAGWPPSDANPNIKSFDYFNSYATREMGLTNREDERKFLRAVYAETQAAFAAQDLKPEDEVTLYRGLMLDKYDWQVGQVHNWKGNTIESWSISRDVADGFAIERGEGMGLTMGIRVPVRNIFSSPRTGIGSLGEGEFIIFGSVPGQTAKVLNAVDFEAAYRDAGYTTTFL